MVIDAVHGLSLPYPLLHIYLMDDARAIELSIDNNVRPHYWKSEELFTVISVNLVFAFV